MVRVNFRGGLQSARRVLESLEKQAGDNVADIELLVRFSKPGVQRFEYAGGDATITMPSRRAWTPERKAAHALAMRKSHARRAKAAR